MKWETKFTQITKTKYPLIMGAFGGWGKAEFASSFSNAGGLGMIAALNFPDYNDFRNDLRVMKNLTDQPFGVNLSLPHYRFGNNNEDKSIKERYLKYVDIALKEEVIVFTTSGYKAEFIGKKVHNGGGYWFHKCVLVDHAISAQKSGADAVTLVGLEGTGFKNPQTHTTLINITVAKKILNIPIIAAGGIGDARGFLGALLMGADAVCLGTALMTTRECPVSKKVKEKWLNLDIFNETFYKKIYKYNVKNFMHPSTSIAHQDKLQTIENLVSKLINRAERLLSSWNFTNFHSINNKSKS